MNNKFTFFWKSHFVFSNWHPSVFTHDGITFNCSEQYMMYHKAKLFGDTEIMDKVMQTDSPKEQKALGRQVKNFNSDEWLTKCFPIMEDGLRSKFEQNPEMLKELLDTGDSIIAEASPVDPIWGIGLAAEDPLAQDVSTWKGTNLLGYVLMSVREKIRKEQNEFSTFMEQKLENNRGVLQTPQKSNISFEEFEKLDIRICKILSVEKVEKADKLYKLEIDTGIDKRIVVSAIAQSFSEKDLLDQHLPFVLNLEPRKIRGIESTAMIILGEMVQSKKLFMVSPLVFDDVIPSGDGWKELIGAIVI